MTLLISMASYWGLKLTATQPSRHDMCDLRPPGLSFCDFFNCVHLLYWIGTYKRCHSLFLTLQNVWNYTGDISSVHYGDCSNNVQLICTDQTVDEAGQRSGVFLATLSSENPWLTPLTQALAVALRETPSNKKLQWAACRLFWVATNKPAMVSGGLACMCAHTGSRAAELSGRVHVLSECVWRCVWCMHTHK